ncbi:MAG: hypothetical protein CVT88_06600 [Candidatus Altiarchaeales archaeon HGW-Altiarchaeales-1]|nr:MAG: hypothetical protein CVT88_06600 [Candidatus Altiarchaeales archaeon HGW-Altiarchaeales-1]
MGFFDWLSGKKEETKTTAPQPAAGNVNLNEAMTTATKEEETIRRYVKVTDLNSIEKIDKIRRDLLAGNVVVADVGEISKSGTDKSSLQMILKELKNKVEDVHGNIARLSEERLILIPSDMRFVRIAGKEE